MEVFFYIIDQKQVSDTKCCLSIVENEVKSGYQGRFQPCKPNLLTFVLVL